MLEVFTGDDWSIIMTLKKDGVAFDVSASTEILASIVSDDQNDPSTIVSAVPCLIGATGADWPNGVVAIEIPNATTTPLEAREAWVELQITLDSKKQTWPRQKIIIKKGTIA